MQTKSPVNADFGHLRVSAKDYLVHYAELPVTYRGSPVVRVTVLLRVPQLGYLRSAVPADSEYAFRDVGIIHLPGGSKPVQCGADEKVLVVGCGRCGDRGHIAVRGDDDVACPVCADDNEATF